MTLNKVYKAIDIPSGVVMSVSTLSILVFLWAAVFWKAEIPNTVTALYGMILGAFAASKTISKFSEGRTETTTEEKGSGKK
jgi:uncharacterized membrane protein AbrB (regulator of aidB expression)